MIEHYYSELFGNIAVASAITAGIIGVAGIAIKIYNLESKIGDIIIWIAAFFCRHSRNSIYYLYLVNLSI
mgnify:CR=1 FL=1